MNHKNNFMLSNNTDPRKFNLKAILDVIKVGKKFTDQIIISSVNIFTVMSNLLAPVKTCPMIKKKISDVDSEVKWPTCGQISVQRGFHCIENLMKKWSTLQGMKDWMFYVEFDHIKSDDWSHFYVYEVMWSIPTSAFPEPQVTVSVHFCVEASKIKPSSYPVEVSYVFEGNKFIHHLNIPFQPKWLFDILDMKTMVFKSINF